MTNDAYADMTLEEMHAQMARLQAQRIAAAQMGETMLVLEIRAAMGRLTEQIRRRMMQEARHEHD